MKTTLQYLADKEYESVNEHGNRIKIDMYAGEEKSHQSPMELVLSAIAACAAVDIVEILKKKRKTVEDMNIQTEGTRRQDPPRYFTDVHVHVSLVSPDTDEETLRKVVALTLEKYCSVASTIDGKAKITHSVTVASEKKLSHADS